LAVTISTGDNFLARMLSVTSAIVAYCGAVIGEARVKA